ncbi:MAG: DUF4846 domain-containing protein [Cyclobacteriaceae bacterium]|nr:DUF4846 domain-containing protein [Cyclobacteriaceae bacterium]
MNKLITYIFLLISFSCTQNSEHKKEVILKALFEPDVKQLGYINPEGQTIESRFLVPSGYERISQNIDSFSGYLRRLLLKPHGSEVLYYDGKIKPNQNIYDAVVDLSIGKRDLHQCADAIIRLRAEYLYEKGDYERIHFNFTNGFNVSYKNWMEGYRIIIEGNKTYWKKTSTPSNTRHDFWKYLETVFSYAGTASLSKELKPIAISDIKIGDVFIKGGFPGHAVIVVDMVENKDTGNKLFLLAQSYMPAQEIQVLKNPNDPALSPWYTTDFGATLNTPEWRFDENSLKRFQN